MTTSNPAMAGDASLAIMESGGFLGFDSKRIAVPANTVEPSGEGHCILRKATEDEPKTMPSLGCAQQPGLGEFK